MNEAQYIDNALLAELARLDRAAFDKRQLAMRVEHKLHNEVFDVRVLRVERVMARLSQILRKKDEAGVRIYGCYSTGNGMRWQRTRAMSYPALKSFVEDQRKRIQDDIAALEPLERLLEEMRRVQEGGEGADEVAA